MRFLNKLCLIVLFGVYCEAQKPVRKEAYMSVPSLIRAAGYPVEKHRVTTPDGYILLMHRIPAGKLSANQTGELNVRRKKAILILHGLGGCSSNFVIMGPKRSLAYLLADAGYDVWLPNLRGTSYTSHTNLTRNDKKFWDFSFHEHGKYDVPALIDRILEVTGLEKIMCLGHSLGTTTFFTMIAQRSEYNDKLIAFVGFAPSVYLDHLKDIVKFGINTFEMSKVARAIGWSAIPPLLVHTLQEHLCNQKQPEIDLCTNLMVAMFGDDSEQLDVEMAPIYLYRLQPFPLGSLEHYAKIALTGVFTTFSGGLFGPVIPYNISNVRIPVSLHHGENDRLTDKAQITRLREELKANAILEDLEPVTWRQFNHIDFAFAKDVDTLLNKPLIKHMDYLYNKYGPVRQIHFFYLTKRGCIKTLTPG